MISDFNARKNALDTGRSFIVQAPAGSGKTGLLVYRILSLLAEVDSPDEVLAITFTVKATSEMRERLLELLHKAERDESSDNDFEQQGINLAKKVLAQSERKQWQILDAPQQLQLLTIDAFCAKLAGQMPWLSRLGDKPRVSDQADAHYAVAVEQVFDQLLQQQPNQLSEALQTVLLGLDYDYAKARSLFTSMLAMRDQWLRHILLNDISALRDQLEQAWQQVVTEQLKLLAEQLADDHFQQLLEIGVIAANNIENKNTPLAVFSELPGDPQNSLAVWQGIAFLLLTADGKGYRKRLDKNTGFPADQKEFKQSMLVILAELVDDQGLLTQLSALTLLPPEQYSDADWELITALDTVLKGLAARLQLRFRAVGECDYSEVAQRANLALSQLGSPTELALKMDYQLKHILVDEFQDTSRSQIDLLQKLTAAWDNTNDSRTVFFVGDPMQSIYRFREADVSLFLQVVNNQETKLFPNLKIDYLQLSENFRSTESLVNWFNNTFSQSFPTQDVVISGAIKYAAATTSNKHSSEISCQLASQDEYEIELVIQELKKSIAELPSSKAKVAILVRSRTHLSQLLPALKEHNINYTGIDIQPLKESAAVQDIIALANALSDFDDRLAWLSLLRGPWCGLSLVEIQTVVEQKGNTVWQQLNQALDSHKLDGSKLANFIEIMQRAVSQRQRVSLAELTRWTWQALGGEHTLFDLQAEDIETVLNLIADLEKSGRLVSPNELDSALDGLFAQSQNTSQPQVVVSTIHKAKGLQYDTVILPKLSSRSRVDEKQMMMWAERNNQEGKSQLLLAPIRLEKEAGAHYDYLRELEKQRAQHELVRLMYVACTRAERKLILTSTVKLDSEKDEIKPPATSSLLATVWETIESQFQLNAEQVELQAEPELSQDYYKLPTGYKTEYPASVDWQRPESWGLQQTPDDKLSMQFDWASEVATAVGVLLHNWLEHNSQRIQKSSVNDDLRQLWRHQLLQLGVPNQRIGSAIKRLSVAIAKMKKDNNAAFIFADYPEQKNEYALSIFENGQVKNYRIDRTFVDENGVRWIVDYKSTTTFEEDVEQFVEQQVEERHKKQLEKYGELFKKLEDRPIKLAVYFPLLSQLREWSYQ